MIATAIATVVSVVTQDGGGHWSNVTPKDLAEWSMVSLIEASPHSAGAAYIAVDRHKLDDLKPYIWKTADFGKSWRAEITPSCEVRRRPTMMDVYKLLPHASRNCKQCGQPTCYTFVLKLAASQKRLEDCTPLFEPQYAGQLMALQEIVVDAPAIG